MKELIQYLKGLKTSYELPNANKGAHNYGAVEALNKAITYAEKISRLDDVSGYTMLEYGNKICAGDEYMRHTGEWVAVPKDSIGSLFDIDKTLQVRRKRNR